MLCSVKMGEEIKNCITLLGSKKSGTEPEREKVVHSLGAACLPGSGSPWWVYVKEAGVSEERKHL